MLSHQPRPEENDDKDEWNCLEDQSSRVELLDSRLNLFLFGEVAPICKVLTHLGREAELAVAMVGPSPHLLGKGVVPEQDTPSGAGLGQDEVPKKSFLHNSLPHLSGRLMR